MSDQQPPVDPYGNPQQPPPYGQQLYPPNAGQAPGQYPYPPLPTEPPASSKSTTALVLGITGLVVCPGVLSIPAWIIGRQAVQEIDASQGRLGGRSQAQAGYILGIVGTCLAALAIIAVVGLFVVGAVFTGTIVNELENSCTYDQSDTSFEFSCNE